MAKFCSVAPITIMKRLGEFDTFPVNVLLLAHDVVKYPYFYEQYWAQRDPKDNELVILDNSAYELMAAVDSDMVWSAVDICRPTCVVLPDIYMDGVLTLKETSYCVIDWAARAKQYSGIELMCIPQGKTFEEWIWCAEHLAKLSDISWWGVPRNVRELHKVPRIEAVEILYALNPKRKIHLFGFSDDYVDDLITSKDCRVSSIDSTTPIRAGSLGLDFSLTMSMPKRGNWWDEAKWDPRIITNLDYVCNLFKREGEVV